MKEDSRCAFEVNNAQTRDSVALKYVSFSFFPKAKVSNASRKIWKSSLYACVKLLQGISSFERSLASPSKVKSNARYFRFLLFKFNSTLNRGEKILN